METIVDTRRRLASIINRELEINLLIYVERNSGL